MRAADDVLRALRNSFPDWLDAKKANNAEEIKGFISEDLAELTGDITARATEVKEELEAIATTYDAIIKDTVSATKSSEVALSARLKDKAAVAKEVNEADAERARLDALVSDLKEEVQKFDKMARDYESRAQTAEERAFIMSIVQVGAQVVSAVIPAFAMAAGGPASAIAASTRGAVGGLTGDKGGAGKDEDDNKDSTAEVIKAKKDVSEKKKEVETSEKKVKELEEQVANLEKELDKEVQKTVESDADADADDKPAGGDAKPDDSAVVQSIKTRVDEAKKDLKAEKEAYSKLKTALTSLRDGLNAAEKGLGKLSDDQKSQANNLRELQIKMLDKAEAYEKERRSQSAELAKINALLKGKRSQEETIQLCIKSLNLSISALKRTKEIVEEIAFFFKSFADFMAQIAKEATDEMKDAQSATAKAAIRSSRLATLVTSIDEFFIRQISEWNATKIVADKFNQSFAAGWSKLNKLSGEYIKGDELVAYLKHASVLLESIVAERETAAKQKIVAIDDYRKQIRESAAA